LTIKTTLFHVCLLSLLTGTACLPVEAPQPECFPLDPCPRGLSCVAGRCERPAERSISVSLSCLSSQVCLDELDDRAQERSPEGGSLCLILEQPQQVTVHRVNLDPTAPQTLSAPLMESALRATLVFLSEPECPQGEGEVSAMGLGLTCVAELSCVLRLRHPQLSAERVAMSEVIALDFSSDQGQCPDRAWGAQSPEERCDGVDQDCDGFLDEGVVCK
jgi:hypothetical protein